MIEQHLPAGTCDTHMHVYDSRHPAAPASLLRPPDATVDQYRDLQAKLGLQRVVVVQPSTYGLDNSCTLDAVTSFGADARAVVVVDDHTTAAQLEQMTARGARGARFHMLPGGAVPWEIMPSVAEHVAEYGWHIQLQMNGRELIDRLDELRALPTPLVIDHVGRYMPPVPADDQRFRVLLALLSTGRVWVKLSAPYESATDPKHQYADVTRLIEALVDQAPERLLWATNWPHPGQSSPPTSDDIQRLAFEWMPDAFSRHRILVDNPVELYGFDPLGTPHSGVS